MAVEQQLQELIEKECKKANSHGIILRVQSGNGQVDSKGCAGVATPDTRFPIASISKMFTGTLVMKLVADRQIDLDQSVQSILSDVDMSSLHVM